MRALVLTATLAMLCDVPAVGAPAPGRATAPATDAKAFVDAIYARWTAAHRRGDTDWVPASDGSVYAPELAALIAKDRRVGEREGGVGMIDYVVLCACQDDAGLRATTTLVAQTARTATVRVALRFGTEAGDPLTLQLVRLPAGWRIADVVNGGDSLLATLRTGLAHER